MSLLITEDEAKKLMVIADKQIDKPYIFGYEVRLSDTSPIAFDCSEIIEWLFYQIGYKFVDGSYNQYDKSNPIEGNLQIGDLGFKARYGKVYHVAMYMYNSRVIEAKGRNYGVVYTPKDVFEQSKHFYGWRRPKLTFIKK